MTDSRLVAAARVIVSLTWLYEGVWLKLIARDPSHLAFIESLGVPRPQMVMIIIGAGQALLGLAVLGGAYPKALAKLQIVLILGTCAAAIFGGGGGAQNPFGLLLANAPLLLCIVIIGWRRTTQTWSRFA